MPWFFVALQVVAPFIHAHAGSVQLNHTGFLHAHQDGQSDASWHVMAEDVHGAEVEVAPGMPLRNGMPAVAADMPLAAMTLPRVCVAARPRTGLPAPPPLHLASPDHTLPPVLAPPSA